MMPSRTSQPPEREALDERFRIGARIAAVNLNRAWWILLITTGFSIVLALLSIRAGMQAPLRAVQAADFAGSAIFLVLLWLARSGRLPFGFWRRLPMAYAVFFVLLGDAYYFSALPVVGDNAAYAFGVLTPGALLLLAPPVYLPFLAVNHALFTWLLLGADVSYQTTLSAMVGSSVAVGLAAFASAFQYSAKTAELRKERVIERQNLEMNRKNEGLRSKAEEMDELMAIVAHDLRAPLLSVASLCRLQKSDPAWKSPAHVEFLDAVEQSTAGMAELVRRLLDAHRSGHDLRDQLQLRPVELRAAAEAACSRARPHAATKEIRIALAPGPTAMAPAADAGAVGRILDNLLSNAVKYSPPGTTVEVALIPGGIEVRDEGPGIPEGETGSLFRKFSRGMNLPTAGEDSSGLGLYIARELARAMGGDLVYLRREPRGSVFRFSLPTF